MLQGTNTKSLGEIVRHGPGDGCVILNVGGKEFHTLRSTVNSNAVLADHVARAEANQEFTKNGAVFIDRDPEHFGFILKHLRNRMEKISADHSISGSSSGSASLASLTKWTKSHVDLPKDSHVLRDLFAEATFYRIPELRDAICSRTWLVNVFSFFNKNANPFDSVTKLAGQIRAGLIAMGSLGTVGGTVLVTTTEEYMHWIQRKIGLGGKKDDLGKSSSSVAGA